ncbi:Putative aminoglycoside phosphotransferase, protein kinase-like domain superfamily [Colletotrichum destructivum]|uniref:Aminoglycoside phosphotransferase, protein kinase-like domain superfamily n=1 Tax=Colletotrichum destructivum TaxID=34406 RepID=A0AAX4IIB9_9PEZI|nr:Putative aminoglycoside phosphotransferase, protein kinase-like domain superfamily [Colletotrichum destructivum]
MNDQHYKQRMDFVESILQSNGLQAESIVPVEYDINSPFPYNNFIYRVTLLSPTTTAITFKSSQSGDPQPGTVPCPADTASLIVRLANSDPRTGINNTHRVESEVAFMTLVRQALAGSKYSCIVPDVYMWSGVSSGQGISVQKCMPGTIPERGGFEDFSLQDKTVLLGQMADILALLQNYTVPETVSKYGGLRFDENGNVISGQMTMFTGEPSLTYRDFLRGIFKVKLEEADNNPVIQGWKQNGIRARLDDFIDHRLEGLLGDDEPQKVLIHADLTTNNLLFDPSTLRVTALLDFDFSYVGTVADEFMGFSFGNLCGGTLPGPFESGTQLALRRAMLTGFPETHLVVGSSEVQWDIAETWDKELARAGAARPCKISRFEEIANIYWLQDRVSPFELDNPMMRKRMTAEQLEETRSRTENLIAEFLGRTSLSSDTSSEGNNL